MKYQGLSGTVYEIEEKKLAGGGEGTVHNLIGNKKQVAKIFKEGRRDSVREKKLQLMVQEKLSEEELQQITWPQDVIYDQNGFAGYIMPKLAHSSSLMELYTEEEYGLPFRLMAACNLAQAIDTVHQMGQVCGDLNPQNIFVNVDKSDQHNRFKVTLVDTDSYHFTADGTIYRCEVGLGQFIAPELQKKTSEGYNLKNVPLPSYTRETDLFALAVHIFCLLMNGCHPFACAKDTASGRSNISRMTAGREEDSVVYPQPIENIKDGFFPFYDTRDGFVTPVYAPEFNSLPDEIREMFIRTFVDGYREPSKRVAAAEWAEALHAVSNNIIHCSEVDSHYYFDHVSKCPLCKVEERIAGTTGGGEPEEDEILSSGSGNDGSGWKRKTPPEPPRLSLKYQIGSIMMFVWAIAVGLFDYLPGAESVSGVVSVVIWIKIAVYVHIALLLRQTQLRRRGLLVFYSIFSGLWMCLSIGALVNNPFDINNLSSYDITYIYMWIRECVVCAAEMTGGTMLVMKCHEWREPLSGVVRLPLKYRMGSAAMFVCAAITIYSGIGGMLNEVIYDLVSRFFYGELIIGYISLVLSTGICIHMGYLLQRTKLHGKWVLVYCSIFLFLFSCGLLDGGIQDRTIFQHVLSVVQYAGFILVLMKSRD